jgi:23S rRNA (adenine2503-C2)-methyltransferase
MPALAKQPLSLLRAGLIAYAETMGRRPSLEFTLIDGVNDTPREIDALVAFAHGILCHVNLIPLNPAVPPPLRASGGPLSPVFAPSPPEHRAAIVARLRGAGIECSVRRSRGADIAGACGQLKGSTG